MVSQTTSDFELARYFSEPDGNERISHTYVLF